MQDGRMQGDETTKAVTIIGNCHSLPLADAFALCGAGLTSDFIDLNFAELPEMATKIEALKADTPPLVFTQPISSTHGKLATDLLRQQLGHDRVITYTNIHFIGLHPDITYLGHFGSRVESFLGPYHSKLVLFSFVTRRSVDDCIQLFNGETYDAVGYMAAFEQSAAELRYREDACDVRFAETFLEMVRQAPSLFTVNHPTAPVFLELAGAMAGHAGLEFRQFEPHFLVNHLANSYIWPVYDAIAEHHQLAYRTPQFFVNTAGRRSRASTLTEFVAGCYASYAGGDFHQLATMVTSAPFFPGFAAKLGV